MENKVKKTEDEIVKESLKVLYAVCDGNPEIGVVKQMDCPLCGGRQALSYTRCESDSGHLRASCSSCHISLVE